MASQPNFLFLITDQHRADHLGCYGNRIVRTPTLDALARRGIVFDRYYVTTPVCMCNRATIMTGRMPSLHGGGTTAFRFPVMMSHSLIYCAQLVTGQAWSGNRTYRI